MLNIATKTQAARYGITVFSILVLFLYNVIFYFLSSKASVLISGSILLPIAAVSIILYNLWKIYKTENDLIISSDKASEIAIAKSKFLAGMSHEIRTPLNSVIGFSEQLGQSKLDQQQAEQLKAIRSSSLMLLDLVNDILDFSKYETRKMNFDKLPFAPIEMIKEVVGIISIQAAEKKIELNTDISLLADAYVLGDSLRLKQVLTNLLSNAIKFTDKGSVTLKAVMILSDKKPLLKVQIIDTGIGMDKRDLAIIFDEFVQVHHSSIRFKHKGTGLGLTICKQIVELQEGEIKVASELGKGSIFSFAIPYELCEQEASRIEKQHVDLSSLTGRRILCADDNRINILLAQTVVTKYKMSTDIAYDGQEAFNLFQQNQYDLILTDIQMPLMSGVALSKAIRSYKHKNKRDIPILGITANVLPKDRELYLQAGMNDLVLKPFSEKDLIEKIAFQLSRASLPHSYIET